MPPSALAGAMAPASPFAFPSQLKALKRDLRADRPFDPDDGKTVGDALSTLGVGDGDLFSSIKKFQKDHGLKVDGWMRPKGPTEKTLNAVLAGGIGAGIPQGKDKADWLTQYALPQDIVSFDFDRGEAGRNAPGDLMKVKRGFGALIPGKLGRLFEDRPDDFGETVEMIKAFQRGAGLKETGWMAPGDDTTKAFAESLRRILPQLADARSEDLASVDPGFLWQRLRGERDPKDKSLFPKGYRNWREMKELGETGSKVPHLIDELAEKNARSDLDYKIDSNFKAESQRIHGLTLLRAAEKDHGGDKRPTPEPSKEGSSEPTDSLAPASESDTLPPVPPSDTTETESKEETPAEETPWSLDQVPIIEVKDEDLVDATYLALGGDGKTSKGMEGKEGRIYYDTNGFPTVGVGQVLVYNSGGTYKVHDPARIGLVISDADLSHLKQIAGLLNDRGKIRNDFSTETGRSALQIVQKTLSEGTEGLAQAMTLLDAKVFSVKKPGFSSGFSDTQDAVVTSALTYLHQAADDPSLSETDKAILSTTIEYMEAMSPSSLEAVQQHDWLAAGNASDTAWPQHYGEALDPGRANYELNLSEEQIRQAFDTVWLGYRNNAKNELGEDLWGRLNENQRAAVF